MDNCPSSKQVFLVIADSHAKYVCSNLSTSHFNIVTYSISGLQWFNPYNSQLCVYNFISQTHITSLIDTVSHILFLVGTNSLRHIRAADVINQVTQIILSLRSRHPHLSQTGKIIIATTFPCLKTSRRFSSVLSLQSNIEIYNGLLSTLSTQQSFSFVNFNVTPDMLSPDHMHLDYHYRTLISQLILEYVNRIPTPQHIPTPPRSRSRSAITQRNRKRHDKLKHQHHMFTLVRDIHPIWSWTHLKSFFCHSQIHYSSLTAIRQHRLTVRFNSLAHLTFAEATILKNISSFSSIAIIV